MALFEDERTPKNGRHLKGVSCDVKNCVYHTEFDQCCADRIAVGPSYASACSDTVCATFRPKSTV